MKNYILRFRKIDKKNFEEVRSGLKSIETRAATIRYQFIEVGDTLTFVCDGERFTKKIIRKYHWSGIETMIKEIPFKKIMPSTASVEVMKKTYSSYPGYEKKIKEHGLLGFELE